MRSRAASNRFSRRRRVLLTLLAVGAIGGGIYAALTLVPGAAFSGRSALKRPAPRSQGYVGSNVCAGCHAEISRTYAAHPMGRALSEVTADVVENYGKAEFSSGPRRYRAERTDSGVVHRVTLLDLAGEPVCEQAERIRYAIGSGAHGRSYLVDQGGLLFVSPISWYAAGARWDRSPGYVADSDYQFERRALDGCLTCHAGRVNSVAGATDRYREPPFLEEAIGCERCHGPGEEHVALHRGGGPDSADPIVNPADLEPARREAVCQQCHLQGVRRILRYGRTEHDFRPGDRLEGVWTTFVHENSTGNDLAEAVSQVEQMRASRCFLESEGRLGCISCHDPHSKPAESERRAFYDDRCLTCHAERGCSLPEPAREAPPAEGSCVACHMPPLATSDIPHTSHTDHRILREPEAAKTTSAAPSGGLTLFDGAADRLPPAEVDRAIGLMLLRSADESRDLSLAQRAADLLKPLLQQAEDDLPVYEALGRARRLQGRDEEAHALWNRALQVDPESETILTLLAKLQYETNRAEQGVATLDRLLAINDASGELHAMRAILLARLERFKEAIASSEAALERNPSLREVYGLLANLHRRQGNVEEADRYQRLFSRFPPAGVNAIDESTSESDKPHW